MASPRLRQTLSDPVNGVQFVDNPQRLHAEMNMLPIVLGLGGREIPTSRRCCTPCHYST
jgi:hypothetical protein